jgi:protein deglycase
MASVLIPLAPGCEELEAITIIDLLRRAKIDVTSASLDKQTVCASRGVMLIADMSLEQALQSEYDMLVLPGGLAGADHLDNEPRIRILLKKMAVQGKITAAICAAPKVLASAGLLDNKTATAYPGTLEKCALTNTSISNAALVQDGNVITSRGPGTAMDFALHLIECLVGKQMRAEVEAGLAR